MIIYDADKEQLYVPEAGDKVLFDPDEVYRRGYQMGYEEGRAKAEQECRDEHDFSKKYMTIEALEDGRITTSYKLEYSLNEGEWQRVINQRVNVHAGDVVRFRGTNAGWSAFAGNDLRMIVYGNVMSLEGGDDFLNTTLQSGALSYLFQYCSGLESAKDLVLPATSLTYSCYYNMFQNCENLKDAPELPATVLAESCYFGMFNGCFSLTEAPALPATALATGCYETMFYTCRSLVSAPELPATSLTERCYNQMFDGCSNLKYIKCLATSTARFSTNYWVDGVSQTGTFVKSADMQSWGTGDSGIPSGWTIIDE